MLCRKLCNKFSNLPLNTLCTSVYKLFKWLRIKGLRLCVNPSWTASFTASSSGNFQLLTASSRGLNRRKSKGDRCGIEAGCSWTCKISVWRVAIIWSAVWGHEPSCNKRTPCDCLCLGFVQMAGRTSTYSMSKYHSLVMWAQTNLVLTENVHRQGLHNLQT